MITITLKQIDELLDKKLKNFATKDDLKLQTAHFDQKLKEQTDLLEKTMGELGNEILEAVDNVSVSKNELAEQEKRISKIQKTLQSV